MRVAESPQRTDLPPPKKKTFRLPIACISQELRSPSITDQTQQGSLQQLYQKEWPGHLQQWHLGGRAISSRAGREGGSWITPTFYLPTQIAGHSHQGRRGNPLARLAPSPQSSQESEGAQRMQGQCLGVALKPGIARLGK